MMLQYFLNSNTRRWWSYVARSYGKGALQSFNIYFMPSARFGENIKLRHPHSHELCKKVLCILFSYCLPHVLLYAHSNISVSRLVVINQVILHSIAGHHGMPNVHIKPINTNSDEYTPSWVCCRPRGDQ